MTVGAFLLILGASARLTHFVTHDKITAPLRESARLPEWVRFLLGCPWCAGLWISFAVGAAWWFTPPKLFAIVAATLTVNLIWALTIGLYEHHTEHDHDDDPAPVSSPQRGRIRI